MRNLFGERQKRQKAKNLCRKHIAQKWGNNVWVLKDYYWLLFLIALEMLSASVLKNSD